MCCRTALLMTACIVYKFRLHLTFDLVSRNLSKRQQLPLYLFLEFDKHHVLIGSGVSDDSQTVDVCSV